MSTFILQWNEGVHTKQIMSVKSRHFYYFYTKSPFQSVHFCQRCRILKCLCYWSPFKLLATRFARLPGLLRQSRSGDFSGDLSRGPNRNVRWLGEQFPAVFLCTRKQTGKPTGTTFPMSQTLQHLLDRMVPHSKLRCNSSDLSFSLVWWIRRLFACCAQLQQFSVDHSAMSVFPSLKCSTHLLTLLAPMQASPYTPRSRS
jgi:hypothetical protein